MSNGEKNSTSYADIADDEFVKELEKPPTRKKGSAPPWIVTFADLTTLMLTFFVLLLSFANIEIIEFQKALGSMQDSFGSQKLEKGIHQLVKEEGSLAEKLGIKKNAPPVNPERQERNALASLITDVAIREGMLDDIKIFIGQDGISVRIDESALFDSGKADIKEKIFPFLNGISKIMRSYNFNLLVEGHTDDIPIKSKIFPSNWELSTVRATTVLRKLLEFGVPKERLAAVGYADRKPALENNSPQNRKKNRRVEFKFIKVE
ncbi:MAG: flagellar motor protein MotB [Nitrospinota bacterium]|nr:flagellar motor protein MotB [Nitrospinota bacterium]